MELNSRDLLLALRPISPTARAGDVHRLAVLGDRAAGDRDAGFAKLFDDGVIGQRRFLVLDVDDFLQLNADAVPGDFLAVGSRGAAHEESLEREDAARRLNPFVVD